MGSDNPQKWLHKSIEREVLREMVQYLWKTWKINGIIHSFFPLLPFRWAQSEQLAQ